MSTSFQSLAHIDLDSVTLPQEESNNIDENQTKINNVQPTVPKSQDVTVEKWDWRADFIPLEWDGTVTLVSPPQPSSPNSDNHSPSEKQDHPQASHVPPTLETISFRDNQTIPPWISNSYSSHNFIDRLHMELIDFCTYISPTQQEHAIRSKLIDKIKAIVTKLWPKAKLHVFGSMKTKLYLPTSDIDLALYPNTNDNVPSGDCKLRLAQTLKDTNMCSYLEIISTARVPLVKFTDAESGLSVDIVFDRESGVIAADEINELQLKYPVLRPLTYFLKYFLWFRDLNEPFRGGMGSYLLQMLIVHLIQTHPIRATRRWRKVDTEISLGGWLMAFFELYGQKFNYSELGISPYPNAHYFLKEEHGMKLYDRPYLLCCECPFESTSSKIMDSGRNTYNIMKIKLAFEWAYNTLLSHHVNGERDSRKSLLGLLVGIRGELVQNRSKENKLIKFQIQNKEIDELLSTSVDMDGMDEWNTSSENEDKANDDGYIPFNDGTSSNDSESSPTSSSGDIDSHGSNDEDSDGVSYAYYEASEFQHKHLFLSHTKTHKNSVDNISMNRRHQSALDLNRNPFLNDSEEDVFKMRKKRLLSPMERESGVDRRPKSKKRKTSNDLHSETSYAVFSNTLSRSFSMPDLRKSTPCIFYQKGECKKGESCPFQHGEDDVRELQENELLVDSNVVGNASTGKVKACWHFAAGHCFHGNKCRWRHEANSGLV